MKKTNIVSSNFKNKEIVETKLGIPPDYQFKALTRGNFVQSNWHKNKLYVIDKLAKLDKKMRVLDLGTGSGNFEIFMHHKVGKITGVDYNKSAIDFLNSYLLNHKINNVELIVADLRNPETLQGLPKYDLIILTDVIEHLKQTDAKILIKSLKKLLSSRGRVIIITPNYKSGWILIENLFDTLGLVPRFKDEQHLSKHNKSNLVKLIKSNNYKLDSICTFNLFSYLTPSSLLSKLFCDIEMLIKYPVGNLIAVVFSK